MCVACEEKPCSFDEYCAIMKWNHFTKNGYTKRVANECEPIHKKPRILSLSQDIDENPQNRQYKFLRKVMSPPEQKDQGQTISNSIFGSITFCGMQSCISSSVINSCNFSPADGYMTTSGCRAN